LNFELRTLNQGKKGQVGKWAGGMGEEPSTFNLQLSTLKGREKGEKGQVGKWAGEQVGKGGRTFNFQHSTFNAQGDRIPTGGGDAAVTRRRDAYATRTLRPPTVRV
jgi:hypothetical protein